MKTNVQRVHLVLKTHLDIGFTDLAANVVSRYLKHFIPQAVALAKATRSSVMNCAGKIDSRPQEARVPLSILPEDHQWPFVPLLLGFLDDV
jgi:hypothetical protein